jgi:hypothetical protein
MAMSDTFTDENPYPLLVGGFNFSRPRDTFTSRFGGMDWSAPLPPRDESAAAAAAAFRHSPVGIAQQHYKPNTFRDLDRDRIMEEHGGTNIHGMELPPPSRGEPAAWWNNIVGETPADAAVNLGLGGVGRLAKAALAMGGLFKATDPAEAGKLFTPSGRLADRAASSFSKIKGGTPAEAMNWRLEHSGIPVEQRTSMPVDKALRVGDEIIPIVGDANRKLHQGYLTEVGGRPLARPVLQEGGFDFALGQPVDPHTKVQDVWGNAQGAATQIDDLARAASERGNRPVVMSTTMAKTGGDFSNQTFDTARQLLDPKLMSDELKTVVDANMKKNMFSQTDAIKDWPGIGAENLDEYIVKKGGNVRAKLMKVLDAARVVNEGGPDIGLVRVANTNPDLYNTPSGYMGYHIANVVPGTGPAAHSTFPIATRGTDVRGFGGSVPGEVVLRDLDKGLRQMYDITGSPQYLNRMDYFAIRPPNKAAKKLGLKPLPKTQVVDQQLLDSIARWVEKNGLKAVPPTLMGGLAALDQYNAR